MAAHGHHGHPGGPALSTSAQALRPGMRTALRWAARGVVAITFGLFLVIAFADLSFD